MDSELQSVKEKFQNFNISLSVDWLRACIQWCKEEILEPNYTFQQLADEIHEQWLSSDLREVDIPVLPPNLSQKKYMVLDGSFSLQMMQVLDISKPMYWQLQQIRKESALSRPDKKETNDSIGTGKRVLQLTLTDGVQFVEAIEYKPIPVLNINIPPGAKIRLSGPVTIRRGRIMLEKNNITIIGGSVESLKVAFAPENILARALKLPENPNPQIIDVSLLSTDTEPENGPPIQNNQTNIQNTRNITHVSNSTTSANKRIQNELKMKSESTNSLSGTTRSCSNDRIVDDFPTDEEFEIMLTTEIEVFNNKASSHVNNEYGKNDVKKQKDPFDEEMELLMEVENQLESRERNDIRHKVNKTPDLFEDDFDPDQIDQVLEMTNKGMLDGMAKKIPTTIEHKRSTQIIPKKDTPQCSDLEGKLSQADILRDFVNEEDLFGVIDLDTLQNSRDKEEIISISNLTQKIRKQSVGIYRIKAKYKSIVEKLALRQEEYHLTIKVGDEEEDLVCKVHNDVVSEWAGLTSKEITNLKTNILSQDIASKFKVEKALKSIVERLLQVDNVMEVQINGSKSAILNGVLEGRLRTIPYAMPSGGGRISTAFVIMCW